MTLDKILREWHYMYNADLEDTFLKAKIEQIHIWARKQLPGKRQKRDHPLHVNQDKTWVSGYNHAIIEMEKKFK